MKYIPVFPIFIGVVVVLGVFMAPVLFPVHPEWFISAAVLGAVTGGIAAACHVGFMEWRRDRREADNCRKTWWKNGGAVHRAAGYIYFVKAAHGRYKIGRTSNVEARLNQLQTGNHERLSVELVIPTNEPDAMERALHRKWAHKRMGGEWFALSRRDMRWVIGRVERVQREYAEQQQQAAR